MPRSGRALQHALTTVVVAAGLLAIPATATAGERAPAGPGQAYAGDRALLPRPLGGRAALDRLGDRLPQAAARNDLAPSALREVLATDDSARLDTAGRLHYVEPVASGPPAPAPGEFEPPAPLAETFQLHSRPGADRVIFLDVDGATVSGTQWNTSYPALASLHPAWDPGGDGPAFSESEQVSVQRVWSLVAEDFAAWDVDVTTEDPGADGLVRSSPEDPAYGSHVLISPSTNAAAAICKGGCGGVAYIDVFDERDGRYQPAWVFPQGLADSPRNVAEAASHEVGHNLGLDHDGGASNPAYYTGHGDWAPIMGVGYGNPVVQWSRGSYAGATNDQDDLAVIGELLDPVADEAPAAAEAAVGLPDGRATIGSAEDVDTFALGACTVGATVAVAPAPLSPNLDLAITVRDGAGAVLELVDPASGRGDGVTASGMGATATLEAATDAVTVSVDGTGTGSWATGYDDYGSLGTYTVAVAGCAGVDEPGVDPEGDPGDPNAEPEEPTIERPGQPRAVAAVRGDREATVSWQPPAAGGPVSGYVVSTLAGGPTVEVDASTTSTSVTGLTNGIGYRFRVVATGAAGDSDVGTSTREVVPAGRPGRVTAPTLRLRHRRLVVRWPAPAANGAPVERYRVKLRGTRKRTLNAERRRVVIRRLPRGRYRVRVLAWNDVGKSAGRVLRFRLR